MKNIVKSVAISQSESDDYLYQVKFVLFPDPGREFFDELVTAIKCELIPPRFRDAMFPHPGGAHSVMVRGKIFFLFDGEIAVDEQSGWYSMWTQDETLFAIGWDAETEEWFIRADFEKLKEGLDKFDYSDWSGIPDNAWIEPAKMIREIFSSK